MNAKLARLKTEEKFKADIKLVESFEANFRPAIERQIEKGRFSLKVASQTGNVEPSMVEYLRAIGYEVDIEMSTSALGSHIAAWVIRW